MNAIAQHCAQSDRALASAALAAFLLQGAVLAYIDRVPVPHHQTSDTPIVAEIYQMPHERTHLYDAKRPMGSAAQKRLPKPLQETALKAATDPATAATPATTEANQTGSEAVGISSHGPIVAYGPAPVIPEFLRSEALKASVLLEFTVDEQGRSTPHLIASSGNDELDALALRATREWRFSPAMRDNQPVAAQVRLRLKFEVK